jgi:hypothetical protein
MPEINQVITSQHLAELSRKVSELKIDLTVEPRQLAETIGRINPNALTPIARLPLDVRESLKKINTDVKRFHGAKLNLDWFPGHLIASPCANKYGYLTAAAVRTASKLDFNVATQALLNKLGDMMGDTGRDTGPDSPIPSGFTYFGQFVDHDITLDVSSSIDVATDATTIHNMRTPSLELDNLYSRGPALDPFLYVFPTIGPATAIKFRLGANNTATGVAKGGPALTVNGTDMKVQTTFDVPRMAGTNTAIIGDPRNDENLIVSQFHMAMLKFHNAVVDMLLAAGFTGDIFVEAKRLVTHHYQWAVINDYLPRICGPAAVTNALAAVAAAVGSAFSMPVEFSVAAYRFGHSIIRNSYWFNHVFTGASLAQVFQFVRNPQLPVQPVWVINFNAFFETGVPLPLNNAVFNKARRIDSVLSNGLESIPGGSGIAARLATMNLRRGLAFGLPSGQATAAALGVAPLTSAQLTSGLPANEISVLNESGALLLTKTPLWYYLLREAAVLSGGNSLGPLGAKIVAETFVRMLKRDADSYLNKAGGFTPILPSKVAGKFTVADLVIFAGVTKP